MGAGFVGRGSMTKAQALERIADLEAVIARMKKEAEGWRRHNLSPKDAEMLYLSKHKMPPQSGPDRGTG